MLYVTYFHTIPKGARASHPTEYTGYPQGLPGSWGPAPRSHNSAGGVGGFGRLWPRCDRGARGVFVVCQHGLHVRHAQPGIGPWQFPTAHPPNEWPVQLLGTMWNDWGSLSKGGEYGEESHFSFCSPTLTIPMIEVKLVCFYGRLMKQHNVLFGKGRYLSGRPSGRVKK